MHGSACESHLYPSTDVLSVPWLTFYPFMCQAVVRDGGCGSLIPRYRGWLLGHEMPRLWWGRSLSECEVERYWLTIAGSTHGFGVEPVSWRGPGLFKSLLHLVTLLTGRLQVSRGQWDLKGVTGRNGLIRTRSGFCFWLLCKSQFVPIHTHGTRTP